MSFAQVTGSLYSQPGTYGAGGGNYSNVPSYLRNSSLWSGYNPGSRQAIQDAYAAGRTLQGVPEAPKAPSAGSGLTADQSWQNSYDQMLGNKPTFPGSTSGGVPGTMSAPGLNKSGPGGIQYPAQNQWPGGPTPGAQDHGNGLDAVNSMLQQLTQGLSNPAGGNDQSNPYLAMLGQYSQLGQQNSPAGGTGIYQPWNQNQF